MSSSRPHHCGYFRPNAREVLPSPALNPDDLGRSAHDQLARELMRYPDTRARFAARRGSGDPEI
jgi:hypothetical protein